MGHSAQGKGPQHPLIPGEDKGHQQEQQGREQVALVHLHGEGVHGRHQQGRAVEHHRPALGTEHPHAAQHRGDHRPQQVQGIPRKAGGQSLPVPADQAPEIIGVYRVKAVIVQGGLVAFQQPKEVEVLGKGQGGQQQCPHCQQHPQAQHAEPAALEGEEQVQGGKDKHLGLAGNGKPIQHRGGDIPLLIEEQQRTQKDGRAKGVRLAPLGRVQKHRRAEEVGPRKQQGAFLPQLPLGQQQHRPPAEQVRQDRGHLDEQGVGLALHGQPQQQPQLL